MNAKAAAGMFLVAVFAQACAGGQDTAPPDALGPTPAAGPARKWTKMGEVAADGLRDRDTVKIEDWDESFRVLGLRFERGRIRIDDVLVQLGDGTVWSPLAPGGVRYERGTITFPLPGGSRTVLAVELRYTDLRNGGGPISVEVWAR